MNQSEWKTRDTMSWMLSSLSLARISTCLQACSAGGVASRKGGERRRKPCLQQLLSGQRCFLNAPCSAA